MIYYKTSDLSQKQQYKYLLGCLVPRPIAWITTLSADGSVVNAAPFSFYSGVSDELPLITIASLRRNGEMKDTARNILDTKEAVVHVVDQIVAEDMNATCTSLPSGESELILTHQTLEDSCTVSVPRIKGTKAQFETVLEHYMPIKNDADEIITDFFFLRVIGYHLDESILDKENDYIITRNLDPVARLAGNQYVKLGEEFTLIRPN